MRRLIQRLKGSIEHFRTFQRLGQYTGRRTDKDFRWMMVCQVIGIAFHSFEPYVWGRTITSLQHQMIAAAALWLVFTAALRMATISLDYWRRVVRNRYQGTIRRNLSAAFQRLFLQKSMGEHLQEGTYLTAEHIRKGEDNGLQMEDTMLFEGYGVLFELGITLVFLVFLSPVVGVMVLGILGFNAVYNLLLTQKILEGMMPLEQRWRKLDSFVEERISKVVHVKSHAQEENTLHRFLGEFNQLFADDDRFWRGFFRRQVTRDGANVVLWLGMVGVGLVLVHQSAIDVGAFLTILLWTQSVLDKIWRLVETETRMSRLMPSVKLSLDALEKPPAIIDDPDALTIGDVTAIEFRGVSFTYPGRPDHVLRDISFTIRRGDRIAVVGESGAGKSTLVMLFQRYFDPQAGSILIDGVPLRRLKLRPWRRLIGLVPQRVELLDGTVGDNIAFGVPDRALDSATLNHVAEQCQVLRFGSRLQAGLDTMIGEDGVQLSGGERQRIAWAIAMVKDPALLIVDEGTSHLDALTEEDLVANLDQFCPGRITLVIAHRLATLKKCTKFLVLRRVDDCPTDQPQLEAVANSFEECRRASPTFRAMLEKQGLPATAATAL